MTSLVYGFVGLGNMGGPMAANLAASRAKSGAPPVVFDKADAAHVPEGAERAGSVADVARRADAVLLSLPDGPAVNAVVDEIATADDRRTAKNSRMRTQLGSGEKVNSPSMSGGWISRGSRS